MADRQAAAAGMGGYYTGGGMGWGSGQHQGGSSWASTGEVYDPDYHNWRQEQLRALDDDYRNWRQERYRRFSDDFSQWRQGRQRGGSSIGGGETGSTTGGGS